MEQYKKRSLDLLNNLNCTNKRYAISPIPHIISSQKHEMNVVNRSLQTKLCRTNEFTKIINDNSPNQLNTNCNYCEQNNNILKKRKFTESLDKYINLENINIIIKEIIKNEYEITIDFNEYFFRRKI
jgi:hypothetical protein